MALWFLRALKNQATYQRDARLKEIAMVDKAIALLSVKDPIAFQAVQAMDLQDQYTSHYDPSDEGEISRIHEREGERDGIEEQMNDDDREFLDDIFPGAAGRAL